MILVVTNKEDGHPTPVISYLTACSVPVFRLNTESLLTDYHFRWWCNKGRCDFWIKNLKNALEIYGHDVTAVWERRPVLPTELPLEGNEEINKHNLTEASGFLSFLLHYINGCFSIGDHLYDRSADSKMLQLEIAGKWGMNVPDTCFSNRKEDILSFANKYEEVTLKSVENDNIRVNDELECVLYTRKVKSALLKELPEEAFSQTVNFVQNYIEKQFELRVTVVGNECFACKLDSQVLGEEQGKIDWRQGYDYGLKHNKYDLPNDITVFCRKFLRQLHLNFGCFDFIVTPKGEYVFLECNPNGQWLWIEMQTGMKISEAIAQCLMKGGIS